MTGLDHADCLTPYDSGALLEFAAHGFKAAAEPSDVVDHDHGPVHHNTDEAHGAVGGSGDRGAVGRLQIDAAVPAQPGFVRRVESTQDGGLGGERPRPVQAGAGGGCTGSRSSSGGRCTQSEHQE
ncbi:hypothetical protein HNP00_000706 [Arthrobacter sp. AZCC_0090]|nr:hypothetical protein [Arthrobacter sp. AZCC_0090]